MKKTVFFLMMLMFSSQGFTQTTSWTVTRWEWTAQDEKNFSAFVKALGESKCNSVVSCLRSTANPYRGSDPKSAKFWSDCADWPYFLRSYFAWKNGLPFGYNSGVRANPSNNPGRDIRYSPNGNSISARTAMNSGKETVDFIKAMNRMQNSISSAMMRVSPDYDGSQINDFYSPNIAPGSIRPGTVVYDPNGHVAVVYNVLADGRIQYFDAHPDNSITYGIYNAKFARSRPAVGAGFKNFRPLKVVNGNIVLSRNQELRDYNLTQYYGSQPNYQDWKKGQFFIRGKSVDFYEYTRASLAQSKINPVLEFETALADLCSNFKERHESVEIATAQGIHLKPHPSTIPANIFVTEGEWESYSTPSRDVRLKVSFQELQRMTTERYMQYYKGDLSDIDYRGADLKRDLLWAFHNANLICPVSYTNSDKKTVNLSFEIGINRLYRLSFDPYHCPERRWGASSARELSSCQDDSNKTAWYHGEQRIRNYNERDWSAPKDITLQMLQNYGQQNPIPIDVRAWLTSLPEKGN